MKRFLISLATLTIVFVASVAAHAQHLEPVIAEFARTADGFFQVRNDSAAPEIVTFEPKSFSLDDEGAGIFRPLDPAVHLELSATSARLNPGATARIFYKVRADALPAWLCIYASFSAAKEGAGVNLRIMLPHTIYVYGKQTLQRSDIVVSAVSYDASSHRFTATIENRGVAAGRASEIEISGNHASQAINGFPMLPHSRRVLSADWTTDKLPDQLRIHFTGFDLKLPVLPTSMEHQ